MSHAASQPVTVTAEIDLDGNGLWVKYKSFRVPNNTFIRHEFPAGFSASRVRTAYDTDTSATVQFDYQ